MKPKNAKNCTKIDRLPAASPVAEDPRVEHRVRAAQLDEHEDDQDGDADAEARERAARRSSPWSGASMIE